VLLSNKPSETWPEILRLTEKHFEIFGENRAMQQPIGHFLTD
jgi:hypothetical protein